jgi:hypothetical protein
MLELTDKNTLTIITSRITKDVGEFQKLDKGTKLKCVDQIYTENKILKELGQLAIDTIEDLDEQNEIKDKKINIMETELKSYNYYDEDKINKLMAKDPVIATNTRERAKRLLARAANKKYGISLNNK